MRKKTPDEMLEEFYQRKGIDTSRHQRNDDRAFEQVKRDEDYKDIRLQVLRDLGINI